MKGQFIADRKMEQMIAEICQEQGISHTLLSDGWVQLLECDGKRGEICGYTFSLNSAAATAIANDKPATSEVLRQASVPHIPHTLLRVGVEGSVHRYSDRIFKGEVVLKPAQGTSGYGVRRFADAVAAEAWVKTSGEPAWALSPFVEVDHEVRYCLLDDELLLAYKKIPVEVDGLKMFNLGLGATPAEYVPREGEIALARSAMQALDLRSGMVDIATTPEGKTMVMEVNASCMLENYLRTSPGNEQRARVVYEKIIAAMF